MAGNYPDVPAPRLAYDRDGTLGFQTDDDTGLVTAMSGAQLATLNDEDADGVEARWANSHGGYTGFIFPELRDILGFFICASSSDNAVAATAMQTSVDSTTGIDGTWVTRIAGNIPYSQGLIPDYRTVNACSYLGIKAIRFHAGTFFGASLMKMIHWYGRIAAGQTPNRLRLWHPTLDQPLDDPAVSPDGAYFDWGNAAQNTQQDRTFRIKNNSATLTANNVTVSTDQPSPPAVGDTRTLSKDGSTFTSTINFTSIAPGALTAVCTLRRVTPANATLSVQVYRILASAVSWT